MDKINRKKLKKIISNLKDDEVVILRRNPITIVFTKDCASFFKNEDNRGYLLFKHDNKYPDMVWLIHLDWDTMLFVNAPSLPYADYDLNIKLLISIEQFAESLEEICQDLSSK